MRHILCVAVTLLIGLASCSKKGNTPAPLQPGTVSFQYNGTTLAWVGTVDTLSDIQITAVGVLPGSTDTSQFYLELENPNIYYDAGLTGAFNDTNFTNGNLVELASFWDVSTNSVYYDVQNLGLPVNGGGHPFLVDVTENSPQLLTGTFSGYLYLSTGSTTDTLIDITNGRFSLAQ